MKKITPLLLVLSLAGVLLLTTSWDSGPGYYKAYTPVFMKKSDLANSVKYLDGERGMENPGKIYAWGDKIFVNERYKGVHVLDNSNPRDPSYENFIVAPGCIDMAVKNGIIYMDNATDLVAFDLATGTVTERITMFPEPACPDGRYHYYNNPDGMIIVGWTER